ncbi:hypothetical protein M011DRAFT_469179 [Sporormia fimetaria CBS 119925]|uniref:Uncharacterized protein n=1 Tax=Sporormia fimetaria CBS 119925 TaxID=1340428 RepID=A0A6A6V778_9PLEO|nr:hypothetical protein M011DRAFT_469179 [Sporormia fimetaria CBS 119925]
MKSGINPTHSLPPFPLSLSLPLTGSCASAFHRFLMSTPAPNLFEPPLICLNSACSSPTHHPGANPQFRLIHRRQHSPTSANHPNNTSLATPPQQQIIPHRSPNTDGDTMM